MFMTKRTFCDFVHYPSGTRYITNAFHMWNERVQLTVKCMQILVRTHESPHSNTCWSSFERVKVVVQTRIGSHSNAGRFSFERISLVHTFLLNACRRWTNVFSFSSERACLIVTCSWFLVRSRLASLLNVFGFSSKRIWLFIRTHLASRPNAFDFFTSHWNASRQWFELVHMWVEHIQTTNALYSRNRYKVPVS